MPENQPFSEVPTDFALVGIRPSVALEMVMTMCGGEQMPSGAMTTGLSPAEMRLWLEDRDAVVDDAVSDYEAPCRSAGLTALTHYEAHPGDIYVTESWMWSMLHRRQDVHPEISTFQWGWSLNAARYVLGWVEMPNPCFLRMAENVMTLVICARSELEKQIAEINAMTFEQFSAHVSAAFRDRN